MDLVQIQIIQIPFHKYVEVVNSTDLVQINQGVAPIFQPIRRGYQQYRLGYEKEDPIY